MSRRSHARLSVVRPTPGAHDVTPNAPVVPAAQRVELHRLAVGEPVLLNIAAADVMTFLGSNWDGLDRLSDPDRLTLAEVILDHFYRRLSVERRGGGERASNIVSNVRRYLLPWAIEETLTRPDVPAANPTRGGAPQRVGDRGPTGVSGLTVLTARDLPVVLSGEQALPAATVAGDLLKRDPLTCCWLTMADAALACAKEQERPTDTAHRIREAIASGSLPTARTADGTRVVAAVMLREADLLQEPAPDVPHGLAKSYASNILTLFSDAVQHAIDLGAQLRGSFTLTAIEPLAHNRIRPPRGKRRPVPLATIHLLAAPLHPTFQLVLWLLAVLALRIGEVFGLTVDDLEDRGGRLWLRVNSQGGHRAWARDERGRLVKVDAQDDVKTGNSKRWVCLPRPLEVLIRDVVRIYHTDPETGELVTGARLVSGLQDSDTSGESAFRTALSAAITAVRGLGGVEETLGLADLDPASVLEVEPHGLRYNVITELKNRGVEERLRRWYVGHGTPVDVHDAYDLGPSHAQLNAVAEVLESWLDESGVATLQAPTTRTEQWGRSSRHGQRAQQILTAQRAAGWVVSHGELPVLLPTAGPDAVLAPTRPTLSSREVAHVLGISDKNARALMRNGRLPAHRVPWGAREVWVSYADDVAAHRAARDRTVTAVSAELGLTYHQTWSLLRGAGRLARRTPGTDLHLDEADVDFLREELDRRAQAAEVAVLVTEAATRLRLSVLTVETLLRQGTLVAAPAPDATRHRYVTVASIDAYNVAHPVGAVAVPDQPLVSSQEARSTLGVTRPQLTALVTSRQLTAVPIGRRQMITLSSVRAYQARRSVSA